MLLWFTFVIIGVFINGPITQLDSKPTDKDSEPCPDCGTKSYVTEQILSASEPLEPERVNEDDNDEKINDAEQESKYVKSIEIITTENKLGERFMSDTEKQNDIRLVQLVDPENDKKNTAVDIKQIVHGQPVEHTELQPNVFEENLEKITIGTMDGEKILHDSQLGIHDEIPGRNEEIPNFEVKSMADVDVVSIVHGVKEGHVHDSGVEIRVKNELFSAGDDVLHAISVHNPKSRQLVDSVGDVALSLAGGIGDEKNKVHEKPSVIQPEDLIHGIGGHDYDVQRIRNLVASEKNVPQAKDPFADLHNFLMHSSQEDDDLHENVRPGKVITYRDIINLGLDEKKLRGVDLRSLLEQNARDYDDWQRERDTVAGEASESSFWETVGKLRQRYLTFGRSNDEASDLTESNLNPAEQVWPSNLQENKDEDEDNVMHQSKILGSTSSKNDIHTDSQKSHHQNGRDVRDL